MTTGWIIYSKADAIENASYIQWFIEEAAAQHLELSLIIREEMQMGIIHQAPTILLNQQTVELPDIAIVRTIEPLLNQMLEDRGVAVYNSSYISRICNHKASTHVAVNQLQVPMVSTLFMKKTHLSSEAPFPFPFVIKEAGGRGGQQVFLIEDQQNWLNRYPKIQSNDLIVQDACAQFGKDLRVYVVGKEIIGAILRESKKDFRANFKLGGTAALYHLSQAEKELVERIIQQFDFGMVGIDFLFDMQGGLLFNEMEDVVGSRTLSAVTNINIVKKYVRHIMNTYQR
ncbi:hypothetical protein DX933_02690 [Ornithinibacillus gellani]|uniref:ATP-grasp domain-containing protein n=1 Tax=Ornithinibacillus gellani TaxID=2293253 RepID=UPI000F494708|nr:hypothetical protein [Ornithinibacillus gellani]TQS76110.1 hypothetical protein DX933_02690 [Ornithinibacillus gellani]